MIPLGQLSIFSSYEDSGLVPTQQTGSYNQRVTLLLIYIIKIIFPPLWSHYSINLFTFQGCILTLTPSSLYQSSCSSRERVLWLRSFSWALEKKSILISEVRFSFSFSQYYVFFSGYLICFWEGTWNKFTFSSLHCSCNLDVVFETGEKNLVQRWSNEPFVVEFSPC